MHLEGMSPAGNLLHGRENISVEKSVLKVKLSVQMQVMERLGFLQKPANADDLETTPMTGEEVQVAFERWERFRFGPRFSNIFLRMYNGYYDDATEKYVDPVRDEQKLVEAITNILREPPEVFQSRYEDTSAAGLHA